MGGWQHAESSRFDQERHSQSARVGMLSEPQRCSLRTGAPLKSSLRQCKIGSGVAIDRTQGIHKLLRAFDVFEERAQAKDRKQSAFMRFQLGQCINSLAQLLDELFACAQDIQLTSYELQTFFYLFVGIRGWGAVRRGVGG